MALHWWPVGPEPATTYWRRRAVVALAVLLPLWLLTSVAGGDDDAERLAQVVPSPTATVPFGPTATTASPTRAPTPRPTPSPRPARCGATALEVVAAAEQDAYDVGARPRLELRITNTGDVACTADVGQSAVELLVVSGNDRIWSSDDCAPGGGARVVTLAPGRAEVSRVTWPGTRSRPGCSGAKEQAQPGTYRVTARVGERRVQGAVFRLEG